MTALSFAATNASVAVAAATATSVPIHVVTSAGLSGFSRFFPFHDLATLNTDDHDLFSFKNLVQDSLEGSNQIRLFTNGCQVGEHTDCTTACADAKLLFGSLETFYNCITLSSMSHWTHDEGKYYISAEAERNASTLMGRGGSLASFNGKPVLASFATCAVASCGADGLHKACNDSVKSLTENSKPSEVFAAMDSFCPDVAAEINPDIFGPGVRFDLENCLLLQPLILNRSSSHTCCR